MYEELLSRIGETIRLERTGKRLSRRALSDLSGISSQTIWSIESGKADPKLTTVAALAEALGTNLVGVITGSPTWQVPNNNMFLEILSDAMKEAHRRTSSSPATHEKLLKDQKEFHDTLGEALDWLDEEKSK